MNIFQMYALLLVLLAVLVAAMFFLVDSRTALAIAAIAMLIAAGVAFAIAAFVRRFNALMRSRFPGQ